MGPTLIGRAGLMVRVQASLQASHRCLSVVGPAGVGKTALMRQALADPILWDVGDVRSADEALYALAMSLDVEVSGRHALQRLGDALASLGPRLLWIDHADRLHDHVLEWLEGWWMQAPELRVVWTSRVHLPARLGPPLRVEPLGEEDALALFARCASPTGELPDGWEEDAEALMPKLGGLPLAIEMAASWTALLTPAELLHRADRIEHWLLHAPTTPERAARLRGAIAWSWSLLTPAAQELAWSVATRPAGVVFEDLEDVAGALGHPEVTSILHELQRHSLLESKACPWTRRQRMRLYEPVRAWLVAQHTPQTQAIAQRGSEVLVERAEHHGLDFDGADPDGAARWLQAERANLLAVMDRERHLRPDWAARAAIALTPLLTTRGPWEVHQRILRDALLCAQAAGDVALIARAARALGTGLTIHGHFAEADRVFEGTYEGLEREERTHSLIIHAHIIAWLDEEDRARRMLDRAERVLEDAASETLLFHKARAHLELQRAFLCQRAGTSDALQAAHAHIERATTRADGAGLKRLGFLSRYVRGQILLGLGRPHQAYASLQAAVEGLVGIGETGSEATGLEWMARAARAYGDLDHARTLLERGITLARQRTDLESEVHLQAEWVEHHMSQQRLDEARQALRRTRRLAAQSQIPASRRLPERLQGHLDRLEALLEDTGHEAQVRVARDGGGWGGEETVSLMARPTLRRVLAGLCEARELRPGQMIDRDTLFAAGWPGESIQTRSRNQRVYTAIWTLRRLGLGDALLSDDDGYALCPVQTTLVARFEDV